ncbi:hypothetical protein MAUB_07080 [Mycolicibacterium aubagnense]|uniref:Uncharacterized protein n=1 Tax=Mycolicibacterium aubagnense TaxID=319707 RepID=A0ABN5YM50_9MYCO|nr:hypothetical protein MAUB_07080 [Mycolicibacterium aubagnense]
MNAPFSEAAAYTLITGPDFSDPESHAESVLTPPIRTRTATARINLRMSHIRKTLGWFPPRGEFRELATVQ